MTEEFVQVDRDTPLLFPPSVQDYLPEDHLALQLGAWCLVFEN